jgi:hypothetical protein
MLPGNDSGLACCKDHPITVNNIAIRRSHLFLADMSYVIFDVRPFIKSKVKRALFHALRK